MKRDDRSIGAIEGRLHEHERELSRTLEAIRERMTSRELVGELYDRARASGYPQALGRAVRDNPLPTVLAGVCAAWLAKSARDAIAGERRARSLETPEAPALSEVALADASEGGRPGESSTGEVGAEETERSERGRAAVPPRTRPEA